MDEEKIKEKIIKEIVVEDEESWMLAREICRENCNRLKPGVSVDTIYEKIRELKKEEKGNNQNR